MVFEVSILPKGQWTQGFTDNEDEDVEDVEGDYDDGAGNADDEEELVSKPKAMTPALCIPLQLAALHENQATFIYTLGSMHYDSPL